ncbi:MAG: helix-turn-helix domain-containing protein [Lacrimispora sp.]|uniref:PucR family transcriptional regulator n=1 Tax=Lacrimispora sp. TaxID=2719234 RepID=UPI0039E4D2B5
MVLIKTIIDMLSVSPIRTQLHDARKYIAVYAYHETEAPMLDSAIIVLRASKFNEIKFEQNRPCLFVIHDCEFEFNTDNTDCDIVEFPGSVGPSQLISEVVAIFEDAAAHARNLSLLTESVLKGGGLNSLFACAAEVFGNPLFLWDISSRAILKAEVAGVDADADEGINIGINKGYATHDFVQRENVLEILSKIAISSEPFIHNQGYAKKNRRLLMRVKSSTQEYDYYLSLAEIKRPFGRFDAALMKHLSELIFLSAQRELNQIHNSIRGTFLLDLLDRNIPDKADCEERLMRIGWHLKPYKFVILIGHKSRDGEDTPAIRANLILTRTQKDFRNQFPWTSSTITKSGIVVMTDFNHLDDIQGFYAELISFLKKNELLAGVSNVFNDILAFRTMYKEAVQSLETGLHLNLPENILPFDDIYFYNLLCAVKDPELVERFCLPGLSELKEDDERYGTAFYETLRNYVLFGRNMREVSRKMFIHRNTVCYRIDKACEMLNIHIDSDTDIYKLFISFKLMEFEQLREK